MIIDHIYNANFITEAQHVIPDNSVDLIVTDPPYLIGYDYWDKKSIEWHNHWLAECKRILKPGGTIWSFMAASSKDGKVPIAFEFAKIMEKYFDVDYRNWVVWARQKGRGASKHLKSQREDLFYATKLGGEKTWNNLKMLREVVTPYVKDGKPRGWFLDENGKRVRFTGLGNVWVYSSPQWNHTTEKQLHPAQKPVMMIERLIRLSSNEGDIILDPFIGSGTTAISCKLSNRNYVGFETDKYNYDIAEKRIKEFNINDYKGYNLYTDKEIEEKMKRLNNKTNISKDSEFFIY